ncbi:MAG: iron donor protein CyaY [Burkholderiaceae bacterium]
MTEQQFLELVDQTLDAIEDAVDACGADVEIDRSGQVLQLSFEDGSRVIVNSQAPMRELWIAARSGGFHFRRDGERWVDTRSGEDMWGCLSRCVSEQAGSSVMLGG